MTQLTESLYRLYDANKITESTLKKLLNDKKITQKDYDYIISGKEV
jgi:hypothetical protein